MLVIFTLTVKFIPDTDQSWGQQAGCHGHDGEAGSGGGDGSHRRIHLRETIPFAGIGKEGFPAMSLPGKLPDMMKKLKRIFGCN